MSDPAGVEAVLAERIRMEIPAMLPGYPERLAAALAPLFAERERAAAEAARRRALEDVLIRADDGNEFGPDNYVRLCHMVSTLALRADALAHTGPQEALEGAQEGRGDAGRPELHRWDSRPKWNDPKHEETI